MTATLRIAIIASSRHPIRQPFAGGLESHVWHLARALERVGHQVTLFAADGSDADVASGNLRVRSFRPSRLASGDPSMPHPEFLADHHAYLGLMLELAEHGADRFDVVHNHSLHYLPLAMAPTLTVPMVSTLHTPPTPWLESATALTGGVGVDFVAVSGHTAAAWESVVKTPIRVVPNGVDTDAWPLGGGGDGAVWFGRITEEKGTHLAIDAAERAGISLRIAGPVSDPAYFRTAVEPRLRAGVVDYLGHLPCADLARLVGDCAVSLVTPDWDEPYGLVVAESLSCGTPVVAFARGGIPEIVDRESGRLVPPGDIGAMASAIADAAMLPRARVRARALAACSETAMVSAYERCYRLAVSRSAARRLQGVSVA
ncbi:glycosyltransferase [Prescottella equi]|uniref:Glycosyltransferase n=1 Tax=Rhodococcus hoagii TaxID=43767 RepID=A0A9Q8W1H3_RHOHA|nr:glycosyltransferase [Prescottella equi]MBM4479625.1 glycosyltransferase [Prescottella equi]MBM4488834.1 glycosyltransferase [Prescottella equi]MBM4498800.1 glycosyltransferase [Prescottella equi]MBM4503763.1 glycosyltransferase [Prescottella equi]MBM4514062.1 glycosyltransferase [Prescottella equi]